MSLRVIFYWKLLSNLPSPYDNVNNLRVSFVPLLVSPNLKYQIVPYPLGSVTTPIKRYFCLGQITSKFFGIGSNLKFFSMSVYPSKFSNKANFLLQNFSKVALKTKFYRCRSTCSRKSFNFSNVIDTILETIIKWNFYEIFEVSDILLALRKKFVTLAIKVPSRTRTFLEGLPFPSK